MRMSQITTGITANKAWAKNRIFQEIIAENLEKTDLEIAAIARHVLDEDDLLEVIASDVRHKRRMVQSKVDKANPKLRAAKAKALKARQIEVQTVAERDAKKMLSELNRRALVAVLNMTGAEVRAARLLPQSMVDRIRDDVKVGDVFTQKAVADALSK